MKLYSDLYLAFCISSRFGGLGGARWEKLSREDLGPVVRKLGAETDRFLRQGKERLGLPPE